MTHPDFVRPSGQWPSELVPNPADAQRLDVSQARLVNGDAGGTWNNAKPIIIGGAGLTYTAGSARGGARTELGGRLVLGANDFVQWSPDRPRSTSMRILHAKVPNTASSFLDDAILLSMPPRPVGLQTSISSLTVDVPSRYLHHGAQLSSISVRFRVVTMPSALPATMPAVLFFGTSSSGSSQTFAPAATPSAWIATHAYALNAYVIPTSAKANGLFYKATTGGTSGGSEPTWPTTVGATVTDGTVTWTCMGFSGTLVAANPVAYYNAGQPQSVTMTFDSATTIDVGTYRYRVTLQGANDASITDPTRNLLVHSVTFAFKGITSAAFG